ncbi:hypothetical protein [Nocardia sp. NPDC050710]|uniref:MBL fold metallo-hydrolase n=1 Tax=Nocardia sp. NPDC050710 TaxID=3157220 RepID=UPI0033D6A0FC
MAPAQRLRTLGHREHHPPLRRGATSRVGGPTLRLHYAGLTWLTDPTFDAPGDYPGPVTLHKLSGPAVPADQVEPVDVVLLSHDQHADNRTW